MSTPPKNITGRMWIRLIKGHKATHDLTVPCQKDSPLSALREAMHELDLSMPVWMPRHQSDWDHFSLAHFTQDHFMDKVDFERMEISYISPDADQKPPKFTED